MNKILTAIALSTALPAVAYAQAAPTSEAKMDCCEKMKAEGKECCCKGHHDEDGAKKDHGEHGKDHAPKGDQHSHQH